MKKNRQAYSWMIFFRSLTFNTLLIFLAVFFSTTGFLFLLAPFKVRYFYITRWSHLIIFLAKNICGIRYEIQGLENLPKTNAVVLCNHQSTWETLFLQTLLPMQTWVLKKELLWIPFFGWGLGLLQPIAIDRNKKSSIKSLMETGKQRLNEGRYIIVFPEGTRLKPGEQRKYSRSGAALAQATSSYILPIAHNAGIFWPKNSFLKYPGVIKVRIGKVLDPKHLTVDTLTQSAQEWIYAQIS